MKAEDFTHAELGALLIAIGKVMITDDLCVGAALDGGSTGALIESMMKNGVDGERAEELVKLDMADVIEVVHLAR